MYLNLIGIGKESALADLEKAETLIREASNILRKVLGRLRVKVEDDNLEDSGSDIISTEAVVKCPRCSNPYCSIQQITVEIVAFN